MAVILVSVTIPPIARAQPVTIVDAVDAVIRRTDAGADGPINPMLQRLPDLVRIRIGAFAPFDPDDDRFSGTWTSAGGYSRVDLDFDGVVNPPGRLGFSSSLPVYDPFEYGPNPFFGFVELDMDANEDTGGDLQSPQFRYLGNVSRFGGLPAEPRFIDRAALNAYAFDGIVTTPPLVDRSGEEFHIAFLGEEISSHEVKYESPGGNIAIFEAGERWLIEGKLLHRAHGFADFALLCFDEEGEYEVEVKIQFKHALTTDTTTVSLVYPLTNADWVAMNDPGKPVDPNDGCADGQNSVEEALDDLQFSAEFADPFDRTLPEFQLIAGWEFNTVAAHLDPAAWRVTALVGSAYGAIEPDGARFIWTDVVPNPLIGDFNADGAVDAADVSELNSFVSANDGISMYDEDGNAGNGSLDWPDFAMNFSLYDTNYDGFVTGADAIVRGDMDLNQDLDLDDADDMAVALADEALYVSTHGGVCPRTRGDMNGDGVFDADDINAFVSELIAP